MRLQFFKPEIRSSSWRSCGSGLALRVSHLRDRVAIGYNLHRRKALSFQPLRNPIYFRFEVRVKWPTPTILMSVPPGGVCTHGDWHNAVVPEGAKQGNNLRATQPSSELPADNVK